MSKNRAQTLRVILRDSKGRFASLSRARFVRIYLGRKKVFEASIPSKWLVKKRRTAIERILFQIEGNILLSRAVKKQEVRAEHLKKLIREEKKTKLKRKEIIKYDSAGEPIYGDIIRIKTGTRDYSKKIIFRDLVSKFFDEIISIATLDYTLKEPLVVEDEVENVEMVLAQAYDLFIPHLLKFRKQVKSRSNIYLLRIKYSTIREIKTRSGKIEELEIKSGIGPGRHEVNSDKDMQELLWESLYEIDYTQHQPKEQRETMASRLVRYVNASSSNEILITGFTMEVVTGELK